MRSLFGLTLLIALGVAADAAAVQHHHPRARHHRFLRPGGASSFDAIPGRRYAPPAPPIFHDQTPSYDDPSKLGSG